MTRVRSFTIFAAVASAIAAPLACVDLFHSTDFETLKPDTGAASDAPTSDGDTQPDAGTKPLVDFCKWTPAEAKTNASRACAWLGACTGVLEGTQLGACMLNATWAYDCDLNPGLRPNGATYALWSCLSDVKSCADVAACVQPRGPDTCPALVSGSFTQCGDAGASELRVECSKPQAGPPGAAEPCALQGRVCTPVDESTSTCGGAAKKTCALGRTCEGTGAVDCRLATGTSILVDFGIDCAAYGAGACASEDAGGDAGTIVACAPSPSAAKSCDAGLAVKCDVDFPMVARSCVGGRAVSVDCSKLGVGCDVSRTVAPYRPFEACAEYVDGGRCIGADTCVDGKLRSCAQGITFEADCAALGLAGCEQIGSSAFAHCVP
jgi:hypothetical protein